MNDKRYLKEMIECYFVIVSILVLFFGVIVLSGSLTGNECWTMLPDFSWDMINTWKEIR